MSDGFLIYLLAISDGVSSFAALLAVICGILGAGARLFAAMDQDFADRYPELEDAKRELIRAAVLRKFSKPTIIAALCCGVVAGFVPTQKQLVSAYALVEGRKVVSAKNAAVAAKDISDKINRLIDAVGGDKGKK